MKLHENQQRKLSLPCGKQSKIGQEVAVDV